MSTEKAIAREINKAMKGYRKEEKNLCNSECCKDGYNKAIEKMQNYYIENINNNKIDTKNLLQRLRMLQKVAFYDRECIMPFMISALSSIVISAFLNIYATENGKGWQLNVQLIDVLNQPDIILTMKRFALYIIFNVVIVVPLIVILFPLFIFAFRKFGKIFFTDLELVFITAEIRMIKENLKTKFNFDIDNIGALPEVIKGKSTNGNNTKSKVRVKIKITKKKRKTFL